MGCRGRCGDRRAGDLDHLQISSPFDAGPAVRDAAAVAAAPPAPGVAPAPAEALVVPAGSAEVAAAARAAGYYVREATGLHPAGGEAPAAIVLDLAGMGEAAAAALLDAAAVRAAALGPRLIAAFAPGQVDAAAAALLGSGAQLLCDPAAPNLAAALALARAAAARVGEPSAEEAARLLRLAAEVARVAEALGGLARGEPAPEDRRGDYVLEEADPGEAPPAAQVRGAIRARRLRDAAFGRGLFEEPAWDMLLDLFAAELEGGRVSVSSLCLASGVAQTTALRWIDRMDSAGLLVRRGDPTDRRRVFLALSAGANAGMRRWFAAVRRAGLTS